MNQAEELSEFKRLFSGDTEAAFFVWDVMRATHIADKFADGQEASQDDMGEMLDILVVRIPTNPFYEKHKSALLPILSNGINCWMVSNRLIHGGSTDTAHAFGYARYIETIIYWVAYITGGQKAAINAINRVHEIYHSETVSEWFDSNVIQEK